MSRQSVRLRHIASLNTACATSEARPYVTLEDVESWRGQLLAEADIEVREPGGGNGIASVDIGDVLFGKLRPYLAKSWVADRPAYASTELLCMRPADGVDSRWLGYVALSLPFVQWAVATSEGTKMPRTSWEKMGDYRLSLPPVAEQRVIADFLDAETVRIDALITRKRRVLELLEERHRSFVWRCVTGQTEPELRPSGLPWVEGVPATWPTVPLYSVAKLGSGHTPSRSRPEWWEDCTIPWISLFDVGRMRDPYQESLTETVQQISELGLANSSARLHPAGTVVLSRTASVGFSTLMHEDMAVSQHFVTWTCGSSLKAEFLLYVIRAMEQHWRALEVGTTNVTVFMPDLEALRIALPPVQEQETIVAAVRSSAKWTRKASVALTRQIDLLAERRQALITAAVTGELDVTHFLGEEAS